MSSETDTIIRLRDGTNVLVYEGDECITLEIDRIDGTPAFALLMPDELHELVQALGAEGVK